MQQQENVPKTSSEKTFARILRILKRVFIFLLISVLLVSGSGVALSFYYQDEVKNYIIGELNKQLNTQIIIDGKNIEFTVLKNFPLASIEFENITALDAISNSKKDTLFNAKIISLQFSIRNIFNKKYHIKKILFNNVELNIRIDKQGNDNYHFWKTSSDTPSENFSFELNEIILKNIQVSYINHKLKQQSNIVIKQSKVSGKFSNDKYAMDIVADLFVNEIKNENTSFIHKKNIEIAIGFDVDNIKQIYNISKGDISIEGLQCELNGNINTGKNGAMNISMKGKKIDIQSALTLIPEEYKKNISDYSSSGNFYFNAAINGPFANDKMPKIVADFGIKNGTISQTSNNVTLNNIILHGIFSTGNTFDIKDFELRLDSFYALLKNGELKGDLIIKDFKNPFIDSKINLNIALEELQKFIQYDTIETISGQLQTKLILLGKWDDLKNITRGQAVLVGSLELSDVYLKIKNRTMPFEKINGSFSFDNNNFIVNNFTGAMANSDFYMKGVFKNATKYLLNTNESITIDATLVSNKLNLDELLENKNENKSTNEQYKLSFSDHINVNINSTIEHLTFRKFEASKLKGVVVIKNKKMMIDSVSLNTMDGNVSMSGIIDGSDSTKLFVNSFSNLNNINISKMFTQCENFGQTYITENNIKGISTASIQFKTYLSPQLDVDLDKLYALIDMTVEKGELINVEGMKNLSRFVELNELMNMRFSTLKNQFEIKNKNISFPKMEIKSNAINLLASGTHSFNNNINYKIKLTLDELLSKKAKKAKKQNDEFGEIADDGLGRTNIFLSMTGTVDNPTIKYDTKEAIQTFKQTVKSEKQTVKNLIKEEFGMFKKDTLKNKPREEAPKFKIEWEEANTKKEEKKELKAPKRKTDDEDF